jgi:sugar lactone lactonase YvrE
VARERATSNAALAPLAPWRVVAGGFLAPPPAPGVVPRPGSGMFVRLVAPSAIALRASDLLVADLASARLWRIDTGFGQATGIAGAPVGPGTALALGPDLSAWVLDSAARQVLRFARDGRLMQTWRGGTESPSPVAFALADGGSTLLVADDSLRRWFEVRPVGAFATPMPQDDSVRGVDGLAVAGDSVFVLDRLAGVVHVAQRDGRLVGRLGAGELKQPLAIAADRFARVFVLDAQDRAVKLLSAGRAAQVFDAAALRVQQIGGIAVDERLLAVSDRLTGQVVIHVIGSGVRP